MAPLKDILFAVLDIAPIRSLVLGSFKPTILPAHVIQSLTHLILEHCNYQWNITPMDIDTVLRHCTQLQSLKIDRVGIRNDFSPVITPTKIILPHLEEMLIVQPVPNSIQTFLYQNVVMPSLQSFAMIVAGDTDSGGEAQGVEYAAMISFISTPSIQSFRYANMPEDHLANVLRALPQLVTLVVDFSGRDTNGIMTFTLPLDVCPQLSEIRIGTTDMGVKRVVRLSDLAALKSFIEARSALLDIAPLQALTIQCDLESLEKAHGDKLRELRDWFSSRVELVWKHVQE